LKAFKSEVEFYVKRLSDEDILEKFEEFQVFL